MKQKTSIAKAALAVKAIFLVCGLAISSWAPMVPFAKSRLGLNDADLGLLLLCLGAGAISFMPVCGLLCKRYGSNKVMLFSSVLLAATLPLLLVIDSVILMGAALYLFGAALGTVDVAMNAHGVQVQNIYGKSIMSSFHGLFSVGGLMGSLGLGALMKAGLDPIAAAVFISILSIVIVLYYYPYLLNRQSEQEATLKFSSESNSPSSSNSNSSASWLKFSVLFLGTMCFIVFLSEGAMLDWSAVFLKENRGIDEKLSGIGYAAFSIAMATMRLLGDRLVSRFSGRTVVISGSLIAASGILLIIIIPSLAISIAGFILLGVGAANIVPVFIGEGGRLKSVPALVAIPAITTIGYAGQIAGPAILGFIAHQYSLPTAFGLIGFLLLAVAISYTLRNHNESL